MKKFITVKYQIESDKIERPFTIGMVSDLHNVVFGEKSESIEKNPGDKAGSSGDPWRPGLG